jgi:16S rRNA (cytosine967-C5)-methyltransferase
VSEIKFKSELAALLREYATSGFYADRVVAEYFQNYSFTAPEKAELSRKFYTLIKNLRLILVKAGLEKEGLTDENAKTIIQTWEKINTNRSELKILERKIRFSVPDWIDELGEKTFGSEKWEDFLKNTFQQPKIFIRVNTLKTTREELINLFSQEKIKVKAVENTVSALEIVTEANIFTNPLFHKGFFEIQDVSSQQVAEFCDLKAGMRVADACAGAGGKTLHMAAIMQNKGKIIALDNIEKKLIELQKRAARAGASCIETRYVSTTKVIKRLESSFDRVLIDVPCSGTGIWKRNADSKWRLAPENFDNLLKTQADILSRYSKMVKSGGKLIYSTCSVFPQEGEEQIKNFINMNSEFWTLEEEKRISTEEFDGFYMAKLIRK